MPAKGDRVDAAVPRVALVFAGGDAVPEAVYRKLPAEALVVGADSGVEHALEAGRTLDVAVGDFDSIDPDVLRAVRQSEVEVLAFPADKDATDLELALAVAVDRGAERLTVVGGHGGRLDHFLANASLLGSDRFAAVEVDAWFGTAHVDVIRAFTRLRGPAGSLVTLLAVHGPARGVTTSGLRFPLADAVLLPGSTVGVSNELLATEATVTVTGGGVVLAIQPDATDPHAGQEA
jgi:thiamine pyrophosphokinase